jgi:hypothetical protein
LTALKLAVSLRSAGFAGAFSSSRARISVERMFPTKSYWYFWVPGAATKAPALACGVERAAAGWGR